MVNDLKLFIYNLRDYDNKHDLRKLLTKNNVKFRNVQKRPVRHIKYGFVSFETVEDRVAAEKQICNIEWKGKRLRTGEVVQSMNDSKRADGQRKRDQYDAELKNGTSDSNKRLKQDGEGGNGPVDVRDKTMPLWRMSYEEQLAKKDEEMKDVLKRIRRKTRKELMKQYRKDEKAKQGKRKKQPKGTEVEMSWGKRAFNRLPGWVQAQDNEGRCCEYGGIKPSPETSGYRNKCEFTVGKDENGAMTVGFRVGSFAETLLVKKADDCTVVPPIVQKLCSSFNALICSGKFGPYNQVDHTGVWRQLTVKCSTRQNEIMAIVQVNVDPASPPPEWGKELEQLKTWFESGEGAWKSLYVQYYTGVSQPDANDPVQHIFGKTKISERLLDLDFDVSPNSFFQINTGGAETLFSVVGNYCVAGLQKASETGGKGEVTEVESKNIGGESESTTPVQAAPSSSVTLVDVCCGTGTIGLCVSKSLGMDVVEKLIGVEMCEAAVADARINATKNGFTNASFVASKAEAVLGNMLHEENAGPGGNGKRIVAIVDPPRAGLHSNVIRALRTCSAIDCLVYVSCNPTKSFIEDVHKLCLPRTKNWRGQPFVPVHSTSVDMFPHAQHCEIVMRLEHVKPEWEAKATPKSDVSGTPENGVEKTKD